MAVISANVAEAIRLLNNGSVIGIPTETVYGLAANAQDTEAVLRIFEVKQRPSFDPLILHTHSFREVEKYVKSIPEKARELASKFWPGPLTLILDKEDSIPDIVTSGLDTVAVRIPNHELTLSLLSQLSFPLVAPSANPFGYVSPTTADHVNQHLGDKIPFILNGQAAKIGLESTIVRITNDKSKILRLGGLPIKEIETVIGPTEVAIHQGSNPQAPGMLDSHYAPRKPLFVGDIDKLLDEYSSSRVGLLTFEKLHSSVPKTRQIVLSSRGDLREAASRLFSGLRHLDQMEVDVVLAEPVPNHDLGMAINDRLKRASH